MMHFHTAASRIHVRSGDVDTWSCAPAGGFGELLELDEVFLPPLTVLPARSEAETLIYLCDGALTSPRSGRLILAGAFQKVTTEAVRRHVNASSTDWARVFRINLAVSTDAPDLGRARGWFGAAERRGRLRLVASPDAESGSLLLPGGVRIYSSLLDAGQHVVCELEAGRCAWLHMVSGSATVMGQLLEASDGIGADAVRSVGITARESSEALVFDLAAPT